MIAMIPPDEVLEILDLMTWSTAPAPPNDNDARLWTGRVIDAVTPATAAIADWSLPDTGRGAMGTVTIGTTVQFLTAEQARHAVALALGTTTQTKLATKHTDCTAADLGCVLPAGHEGLHTCDLTDPRRRS